MSFPFVYADPAWQFETWSEEGKDRSPEEHYECMPLDEIKALPVRQIVPEDAACGLWVIDTMIDEGIKVLTEWGFTYKTVLFYYVKVGRGLRPHMGMGYWTRANPEICLFGTRGKPKRNGKGVERLILDLDPSEKTILAPRGEHSAKPLEAYNRIERLLDGPYIELFARHARAGWHQWGNEVGKTGGTPNLFHLPGHPARAANDNSLFGAAL
ncbi:DNA methyltransferase [Bradyrhizobium barranii subsp. barranii]|uniref:DNA methyltransferase n=1 Tax=Bradyrhizobium barranii subsp. barranii TaxID=2823807 RepID=A0A939MGH5_9BRAD|nr:MT-A70 family methyltransferase [Bradyrhizobium barranii]UEM09282.1 DNA methyltransferase [Bradyrhizobium barranii subsp. barranii]